MLPKILFIFKAGPSPPSDVDTAMPCYECSMLGYGSACQNCSRFIATTPSAPPPSAVSDNVFSFDFTYPLPTRLPTIETRFTADPFKSVTKQSYRTWKDLEAAAPSIKVSRFNWSEMNLSNDCGIFEDFTPNQKEILSCIYDLTPELCQKKQSTDCAVCSLIPYRSVCTKCHQVQSSKADGHCTLTLDGNTVVTVTGCEAYYPDSIIDRYYYEDPDSQDNYAPNKLLLEQQRRFAEFLAAQDDELPQFSSDRERVAAWIAASCVSASAAADDDDASVLGREIGSEWGVGFEGYTSLGVFGAERWEESVSTWAF